MTAARLTVIFDGECGFCTRSAAWLTRLDRHGRIELCPFQRPGVLATYGITRNQAASTVWACDGERTTSGAQAVNLALDAALGTRIFTRLYRWWGIGWVQRRVYAWVAAHRHRLPGVRPWCQTHPGDCSGK